MSKDQQSFHAANIAAKYAHERNLIYNFATSKNPKIFHFIKEFTKTHVLPFQLHTDSTSVETDVDKAELFNQYFYSVFTRSDFPVLDPIDLPIPDNLLDSISKRYLMLLLILIHTKQVELITFLPQF